MAGKIGSKDISYATDPEFEPTPLGKYEWTGVDWDSAGRMEPGSGFVVLSDDDGQDVYLRPSAFPENFRDVLSSAADPNGRLPDGLLTVKNKRGHEVKFDPKHLVQHPQNVHEVDNYEPDMSARDAEVSARRANVIDRAEGMSEAYTDTARDALVDTAKLGVAASVLGPAGGALWAADQTGTPAYKQGMDAVAGAASRGLEVVGQGVRTMFPNAAGPAPQSPGKVDPKSLVMAGAQPPAGNMVMQDAANPGPGGSTSAGMRMSGPAGAVPGEWVTKGAVEGAFGQLGAAQDATGAAAKKAYADEAGIREGQHRALVEHAAKEQETQRRVLEEQTGAIKAYEEAVKSLSSPKETVDPQRWWHSRTTGQKFLAGVGMLLGGVGAGTMAAVGADSRNRVFDMLDKAIDDDIAAQKFDIENRMQGRRDAAQGAYNLYGMMRSKGLDEVEAMQASRAAMLDQFEKQLDIHAAKTNAAMVDPKVAEAKAKIQLEKQATLDQMWQRRGEMALRRQSLALQARETEAKLQGADPGVTLKPGMVDTLSQLKSGLAAAKNLSSEYENKATGFFSKLSQHNPWSDAGEYKQTRQAYLQVIGKMLEGGVLREGDIARYEQMIPKAGDVNADAAFKSLFDLMQRQYSDYFKTYSAAGYDMRGQDTPEDLGGGADDYATRNGFQRR